MPPLPPEPLTHPLEQFQQKCAAVLRPELRENKEIEHFRDSEKSGTALERIAPADVAIAILSSKRIVDHPMLAGKHLISNPDPELRFLLQLDAKMFHARHPVA
ncbi:hypothetical protein [Mesorhizobium sp. CN2-181]|uniref:hypothetical protein n=1 Tax=Mesorhizobium yinganensis TaxID=3157707 RepID=UPI0032B7CDB3